MTTKEPLPTGEALEVSAVWDALNGNVRSSWTTDVALGTAPAVPLLQITDGSASGR